MVSLEDDLKIPFLPAASPGSQSKIRRRCLLPGAAPGRRRRASPPAIAEPRTSETAYFWELTPACFGVAGRLQLRDLRILVAGPAAQAGSAEILPRLCRRLLRLEAPLNPAAPGGGVAKLLRSSPLMSSEDCAGVIANAIPCRTQCSCSAGVAPSVQVRGKLEKRQILAGCKIFRHYGRCAWPSIFRKESCSARKTD